jgi:hypothetical protein
MMVPFRVITPFAALAAAFGFPFIASGPFIAAAETKLIPRNSTISTTNIFFIYDSSFLFFGTTLRGTKFCCSIAPFCPYLPGGRHFFFDYERLTAHISALPAAI